MSSMSTPVFVSTTPPPARNYIDRRCLYERPGRNLVQGSGANRPHDRGAPSRPSATFLDRASSPVPPQTSIDLNERTTMSNDNTATNGSRTASQWIIEEVTSWPGVKASQGARGELAFTVGRHEIGHLHGDRAAHFSFPRRIGAELRERGRVGPHPVAPQSVAWAARTIGNIADIRDVIELLRINYDRVVARFGPPDA